MSPVASDPAKPVLRTDVTMADVAAIRALVARTAFFTDEEVAIAAELAELRLMNGGASGYHFILASIGGALVGYTCFGPIGGAERAFDLYWIAVDPRHQGAGLGKQLLSKTETELRALGATRYYADTSSTARYAPTRRFYETAGFREVASIPDFYREGDGKIIYQKRL